MFYCVTLGKLPELSVLHFPRGFIFWLCFGGEAYVPVTLCMGFMQVISSSPLQLVLLLCQFYRPGSFRERSCSQ